MSREPIRVWLLMAVLLAATAPSTARCQVPSRAADSSVVVPDTARTIERPLPGGQREERLRQAEAERAQLKETLERMSRQEVAGKRQWERRKSGKVALYSSAILPGLGQVYNGRRIKVAVMVGVASGYIAQIWLNTKAAQRARAKRDRLTPGTSAYNLQNRLSNFYEDEARTWGWWTGAVWIIGMLDAWTDAHLYDIRAYTPPADESAAAGAVSVPGARASYLTLSVDF